MIIGGAELLTRTQIAILLDRAHTHNTTQKNSSAAPPCPCLVRQRLRHRRLVVARHVLGRVDVQHALLGAVLVALPVHAGVRVGRLARQAAVLGRPVFLRRGGGKACVFLLRLQKSN